MSIDSGVAGARIRRRSDRPITLGILVLGLVVAGDSGLTLLRTGRFVASERETPGSVFGMSEAIAASRHGGSRLVDVAHDRYTVDERSLEGHEDGMSAMLGQTVPVLYDPAAHEHARVNSWARLWFSTSLVFATGAFLVAIALIVLLRHAPA